MKGGLVGVLLPTPFSRGPKSAYVLLVRLLYWRAGRGEDKKVLELPIKVCNEIIYVGN